MTSEEKIKERLARCTPEAQIAFQKILEVEKDKLYLTKPHGIYEDLLRAIKEVVS